MRLRHGFLVVLSLILIGCGGDGGSSSPPEPEVIHLKTNTIRSLQAGDTWNYSGTWTYNNGNGDVSNTVTPQSHILSSMKLDPLLSINTIDQLTELPNNSNAHSYFLQDGTGSLFEYGGTLNTNSDVWVTIGSGGNFLFYLSPVAVGQKHNANVTYNDGSTETFSASVIGTENVQTGVGLLEAYKITENVTFNNVDGTKDVRYNLPSMIRIIQQVMSSVAGNLI